jgi:HSP20 family protein
MAEISRVPVKTETKESDRAIGSAVRPFENLRQEINRLFDDFHRGYWRFPFSRSLFDAEPLWRGEMTFGTVPAVDVVENGNAYKVTAELPGLSEKDIDVRFVDGVLTIKGEKQEEKEDKSEDYYVSERRYGSFRRCFRVPDGVRADKIDASFKNGILTVQLPKAAEAAKSEKKIEIKAA